MATIAPQNTKMGDPLRQKKAKIAFSGLTENMVGRFPTTRRKRMEEEVDICNRYSIQTA